MNLIIVESPTKAKTLGKFLGKDFELLATKGHIKDLPKSTLGIEIEKKFKPDYVVVPNKEDVIKDIKKAAKKAKEIYLATDPDREGEAISAHVKEIVNDDPKIKRIVFHEITKSAVEEALKKPGKVDKNLVNAQIARRVLDRLVGYKLSPLLWKKVRRGLSAGRVQTVVVKLIVEKEREIEAFKVDEFWEVFVELSTSKKENIIVKLLKVNDKKVAIENEKSSKEIVDSLEKASYKVIEVNKKEIKKSSSPPYTTSTLSQAASRLMGWSAKRIMSIAQSLYEEGLITYHRTDSTNVAEGAVKSLRNYIKNKFGQEYLSEDIRLFKTKSKVAQEAHEAIRPTSEKKEMLEESKFKKDQQILYKIIWKRFVATQMSPCIYDETKIDVLAEEKTNNYLLRVTGQIMKFEGWRKVFTGLDTSKLELPKVLANDSLQLIKVQPEQKFTQPPDRYTEATLIKTLESLEIGRPSTYAPTISTVQIRNYVEKNEGKFSPTNVGIAVNDFLVGNFPETFDYKFTADMENNLDEIANGKIVWTEPIESFWEPFEKILEKVTEKSKRVKIEVEKTDKDCPKCKKGKMVIRIGRFGKFLSCERFPDCDYKEKYIEKVGMKCPECKEGDVIVQKTKKNRKFFGCSRYPDCKWASWRKPTSDIKSSS
ncbi:MAG: type I DNA topoisomerase [Patescibacteria group bacterium]